LRRWHGISTGWRESEFVFCNNIDMSTITMDSVTANAVGDIGAKSSTAPAPDISSAPGGRCVIGKVASPPRHEASSEEFCFWVDPEILVEKTQIVTTESTVGGQRILFYGLVNEVYRESRQARIAEEFDRHDGDVAYEPPFNSKGVTYAVVSILRTEPPVLAPPLEGSNVFLGNSDEASKAYGADEMGAAMNVGLIKNGGLHLAGPGAIDTDYLLGSNGGHLNVTGVAGRATKSAFLLHMNYLLLHNAREAARNNPGDPNRRRVVPIILNVKNFDLFHIDRPNKSFDPAKHLADWCELGIETPGPFTNVSFYAPQLPGQSVPRDTGRHMSDVRPYSWSLADIIAGGLLSYLFADEDFRNPNFSALVLDLENWLTRETDGPNGTRVRALFDSDDRPRTFDDLLDTVRGWADSGGAPFGASHHTGTYRMLARRLLKLVYESRGVLRRQDREGNPLRVTARDTRDPVVIDLSSLAGAPALQRFVVATIFRQLVDDRTGSAVQPGLVYLVTLDELNRFAPKGSHDPITQLIEQVAAEMRSQGIILLGAQQQASLVSTRVIENAGIRALGKSGAVELGESVWRFLSDSAKRKAGTLLPSEKLLIQDSFREPMLVKVPFPAWALRGEEAMTAPTVPHDGPHAGGSGPVPLENP
jgi:uncharacterized protein